MGLPRAVPTALPSAGHLPKPSSLSVRILSSHLSVPSLHNASLIRFLFPTNPLPTYPHLHFYDPLVLSQSSGVHQPACIWSLINFAAHHHTDGSQRIYLPPTVVIRLLEPVASFIKISRVTLELLSQNYPSPVPPLKERGATTG